MRIQINHQFIRIQIKFGNYNEMVRDTSSRQFNLKHHITGDEAGLTLRASTNVS